MDENFNERLYEGDSEGTGIDTRLNFDWIVNSQLNRILILGSENIENISKYINAIKRFDIFLAAYWDKKYEEAIKTMDTKYEENVRKLPDQRADPNGYNQALGELIIEYYDNKFKEIMRLMGRKGLLPLATGSM